MSSKMLVSKRAHLSFLQPSAGTGGVREATCGGRRAGGVGQASLPASSGGIPAARFPGRAPPRNREPGAGMPRPLAGRDACPTRLARTPSRVQETELRPIEKNHPSPRVSAITFAVVSPGRATPRARCSQFSTGGDVARLTRCFSSQPSSQLVHLRRGQLLDGFFNLNEAAHGRKLAGHAQNRHEPKPSLRAGISSRTSLGFGVPRLRGR